MKLQHVGFDLKNIVLTSSDDGDERVTIMKKCSLMLGSRFDRIVYIGDAEWDMQATKDTQMALHRSRRAIKGKMRILGRKTFRVTIRS